MILDMEQAAELVHFYRTTDATYKEAGKKFGISRSGAHAIVTGRHSPTCFGRLRRLRMDARMQNPPKKRHVTPLAMKILWNDYYRLIHSNPARIGLIRPDVECVPYLEESWPR